MGDKIWGYEILRIFGTRGLVESNAEDGTVRVILQGQAPQVFEARAGSADYFERYLQSLLGLAEMPLAIGDELSPTRWVIRGREQARRQG